MTIGPKIREIRKEKGWTQADLAREINSSEIDATVISRIESGIKKRLSPELLSKIAIALDTSLEKLNQSSILKEPLKVGLAFCEWAAPLLKMCISKDNIPNVKIAFYSLMNNPYWHIYTKDNSNAVRITNFEKAYKEQNLHFQENKFLDWTNKELKNIQLYTVSMLVELLDSAVLDLIAIPAETSKRHTNIVRIGSIAESYIDGVQCVYLKQFANKSDKDEFSNEFAQKIKIKSYSKFTEAINISRSQTLNIIVPEITIAEEHVRKHWSALNGNNFNFDYHAINNWIEFTSYINSVLNTNNEVAVLIWEPYTGWLKEKYDNRTTFFYDTYLQELYEPVEEHIDNSSYDLFLSISNVQNWVDEDLFKDFIQKLHDQCNLLNLQIEEKNIPHHSDARKLAKFTDMELARFETVLKKYRFKFRFDTDFILKYGYTKI